jgi:hypothetical protein
MPQHISLNFDMTRSPIGDGGQKNLQTWDDAIIGFAIDKTGDADTGGVVLK